MRNWAKPVCAAIIGSAITGGVQASQEEHRCAKQADLVMGVVQGRLDGIRKGKARRVLRQELGRTAGDMLADWVYSLPKDQLSDEIGVIWTAQCEAL